MVKRRIVASVLITSIFLILFTFIYFRYFDEQKQVELDIKESEEILYNSNIIKDVNYTSKDSDGNEYIINALEGEIDYSQPNIIYLTNVKAIINLNDSKKINITSNFGRYNTDNFDTIFSKNVIIKYLENTINSEYLDFSIGRNTMIISKNVVYNNQENILKADVVEIDIKTKDTKIFMHENKKKVHIKSIN